MTASADTDQRVDHPRTSIRWGSWARKIRIASALTNPTITLRGMNRISRATPSAPSTSWKRRPG